MLRRGAVIGSASDADIILRVSPAEISVGSQTFDMLKIPRISRAQGMDVLSSQANLAGYRAVIDAGGCVFARGADDDDGGGDGDAREVCDYRGGGGGVAGDCDSAAAGWRGFRV